METEEKKQEVKEEKEEKMETDEKKEPEKEADKEEKDEKSDGRGISCRGGEIGFRVRNSHKLSRQRN